MGRWQVVIPEATTNKVLNPSAETTGNFNEATIGSNVQRVTTYSWRGGYCYSAQTFDAGDGALFTLSALTNAIHYVTMRVRGTLPSGGWGWQLDGATTNTPTLIADQGDWLLYGCQIPAAQCNASTTLSVIQVGATGWVINIDAIQVEEKSYWTTYCDGDEGGCSWTGTIHGSSSTRSAQYRGGGRVRDFETDYNVGVTAMLGWGVPALSVGSMEYATLPGGVVQQIRPTMRQWELVFESPSPSMSALHTLRDYLVEAFRPDKVSPPQPVRLHYTGSTTHVEIDAWYVGGLEGELVGDDGVTESPSIRLLSEDPFFYNLAHSSAALDSMNNANVYELAGRSTTGDWTGLGITSLAAGPSGKTIVCVIAVSPDGTLYIGGDFQNLNGIAACDYIAKRSTTGVWSALGAGLNDIVYALAFGPDGTLYVGGSFTNAGGDANADYIAKWTGAAFAAVSATTLNAGVRAIAADQSGNLYVGGVFTDVAGDGNADYIVKLTGGAWVTLGTTPLNSWVNAIVVGLDGLIYIGGVFTDGGGLTNADRIVAWDGTNWIALGEGLNQVVNALTIGPDGALYAAGVFGQSGSALMRFVAQWNGSKWSPLGSPTALGGGTQAAPIAVGPNGIVYVGGDFTSADGLYSAAFLAAWNNSSWIPLDISLPGSPLLYSICAPWTGPLSGQLLIGFDTAGVVNSSGQTTVTNIGDRTAYPTIKIKRSGGTSARVQYIKNETTGDTLYLDYSLLDGETLTIDLDYQRDPTKTTPKTSGHKRITSDYFGDVIGRALVPGSDLAAFSLVPGANTISTFVVEGGAATITSWLEYREPYWSPDGAI